MSKEAFFKVAKLDKWLNILESSQTLQICHGQSVIALIDHQLALIFVIVEASE